MLEIKPSFESLSNFKCPDWFENAKLGIWSHWGPQSVPMYGDWYAKNMYIEGSPQYLYHIRHYGHPSKFGYKDLCKLWKAEKFEPERLMELYYKAGARYFVAQAMHHDHFFNYDSKLNSFNSCEMGPMKDICGAWKKAAEGYNLPFGLTEHLGASFTWWKTNKSCDSYGPYKGVPYDGNDEGYRDFYFDNYEHTEGEQPWYTQNEKFQSYWLDVMKEIIDLYEPDLLYSDGPLPFGNQTSQLNDSAYLRGLEAVAYLYNKSIDRHGENKAVYNQKDRRPQVYQIGILDVEKSQLTAINPTVWQTDTCIGNWFYDVNQVYKKPSHIIEMLIDIVSKNGNMLLNILQRPDGTIDEEATYILEEMAKWIEVCGEGIYNTKPWRVFGEGISSVVIDGFKENQVEWTSSDYRFTSKDDYVYAFVLHTPEDRIAVLHSFTAQDCVTSVKLLGLDDDLPFTQCYGKLIVNLPAKMPSEYTNCLKIKLK